MRKAVSLLIAVLVCLWSMAASAAAAEGSWADVLAEYPHKPVELLEGNIDVYGSHDWNEALIELREQGMEDVRIFAADGTQVSLAADARICTGQHGCFYFGGYDEGVRLFDIVVHGDVLGNGMLNIAQVVRLAQAINGSKPLTGLYLLAGDINRNGTVDISDLSILAEWLVKSHSTPKLSVQEGRFRFPAVLPLP